MTADPHVTPEAPATEDDETLEEWAANLVADWPPLTPEQRDRLAVLLRGGPGPQPTADTQDIAA